MRGERGQPCALAPPGRLLDATDPRAARRARLGAYRRGGRRPPLLRPEGLPAGTSRDHGPGVLEARVVEEGAAAGHPHADPSAAVLYPLPHHWHCDVVSPVSSDCSTASTTRTSTAAQSSTTAGA
jgi:hypothetical protein